MTPSIYILNSSSLKQQDLEFTIRKVKDIFHLPISTAQNSFDLKQALDISRQQYNSTALLAQILQSQFPVENKKIAIVDVDLYIPILTFVFGEAQLDGTSAIVSSSRLSNQFYGLPEDHDLMLKRLTKEIVHELCHTFGLIHCHQFECVLRSSTSVEEIDLKRSEPCADCKKLLEEKIKNCSE